METLYCPCDDHALLIQKTGQIHLAYCPQCHGSWYYGETLAKLFNLRRNRDLLDFSKELFAQKESSRSCPQCHTHLVAKTFYDNQGLTIEQCHGCHGVWLECGELAKTRTILRNKMDTGELHTRPVRGAQDAVTVNRYAPFRGYPVAKTQQPLPNVIRQLPPVELRHWPTTSGESYDVTPRIIRTSSTRVPELKDFKEVEPLPPHEQPQVQIDDDDPERNERQEEIELENGVASSEVNALIWTFTVLTGLPLEVYNPPRKRFPYVTLTLIAINIFILAFIYTFYLTRVEAVFHEYGAIPRHIFQGSLLGLLSHMFLHGGWLHLLGNMYFLWLFGDNVEDRLGHWKFLLFYLVCGFVACFAQLLVMGIQSHIPLVGASGAVAGVMGAYVYLFPKSYLYQRILFIPWPFKIPVTIYLLFWVGIQFFLSYYAPDEGVAWWAHIAGFFFGLAVIFVWYQMRPRWKNPFRRAVPH